MAVVLVYLTAQFILSILVIVASLYLYLWLAVFSYHSQCSNANKKGENQIFSKLVVNLLN